MWWPKWKRRRSGSSKSRSSSCSDSSLLLEPLDSDSEKNTSNVPYGDSFHAYTRYCITRAPGNRSQLKVHGGVTFSKKVFGLVKNMIVKNADDAMKDNFDFLTTTLRSESDLLHCAPIPVKNHAPKKRKVTEQRSTSNRRSSILKTEDAKASENSTPRKTPSPVDPTPAVATVLDSSSWMRWFIGILVLLVAINFYLFNRLRSLEHTLNATPDWTMPKEMPTTKEEWSSLFEYQKNLHNLEMNKFKEVIGNAANLVKNVESSIGALYSELDKGVNAETKKTIPSDGGSEDSRVKDGL